MTVVAVNNYKGQEERRTACPECGSAAPRLGCVVARNGDQVDDKTRSEYKEAAVASTCFVKNFCSGEKKFTLENLIGEKSPSNENACTIWAPLDRIAPSGGADSKWIPFLDTSGPTIPKTAPYYRCSVTKSE